MDVDLVILETCAKHVIANSFLTLTTVKNKSEVNGNWRNKWLSDNHNIQYYFYIYLKSMEDYEGIFKNNPFFIDKVSFLSLLGRVKCSDLGLGRIKNFTYQLKKNILY